MHFLRKNVHKNKYKHLIYNECNDIKSVFNK